MKKLLVLIITMCVAWTFNSYAALTLNVSRVVYNEKDGDAQLSVNNDENRTYLIQSWLDAGDPVNVKKALPFVVTPPLFRLDGNSDNVIRVVYLGTGLPTDKESLFWLNVKGIPGLNDAEKKFENRMVLAVDNRIKVFFRPASLNGNASDAMKNLSWTRNGNRITVENKQPYHVVLNKITAGSEDITVSVLDNNSLITPFGQKTFTLKHAPAQGETIAWTAVNDFGLTSKSFSQRFE